MLDQRHKNYIAYYEKKGGMIIQYARKELIQMDILKLLTLMPNNQCFDEYSTEFGYHITKYIASFKINKDIDGTWHIGYYEGHQDKPLKEQQTLFEISYVKDLKKGLVDLFLIVQGNHLNIWAEIKSGKRKIGLSDSWDKPR